MANFDWTGHDEQLFDLYITQNLSATQVAKVFGVSRNAVIGRAHRNGWSKPKEGREFNARASRRIQSANDRKAKARSGAAKRLYAPKALRQPIPPPVLLTGAEKPWTERLFGECAYPVAGAGADTLSCCQPSGDHRYCAGHRAIMFVKPEPVKKLYRMAGRIAA